MKAKQVSAGILPHQVTPANINYIIQGMEFGDELKFAPTKTGGVNVLIKTKGNQTSRLQHRLDFVLNPLPVTQSWLPNSLADDGSGRHIRVIDKKSQAHKAIKEKTNLKSVLKQAFEMALAFMTLEDALEIQENSLSTYLKFKVGVYFVYTKLDMKPVMYTENNGELNYL